MIEEVIFNESKSTATTLAAGIKEGERMVKEQDALEKLDELAEGSARIILRIKAVFPFNFFPDEVIIDETKVSIHANYFFYSRQITSMEYKDIFNVIVQQGIIFAKLEIADRFFTQQPVVIEFLKRNEAIRARKIIQGLMLAAKEDIDVKGLPMDELTAKLDKIGDSD